jgi:hypothetical protein
MSSVGDRTDSANHHAATETKEGNCMNQRRVYMVLLIIIGVALIALAIYYWVTPAGSLPSFFPGHLAGSAHKHVKHGVAALLVGIACCLGAWMLSGKQRESLSEPPQA